MKNIGKVLEKILKRFYLTLCKVRELPQHKIILLIYLLSLIVQIISVIMFLHFSPVKLNHDYWYKATAINIINEHTAKVDWGNDINSDLHTELNIQKGIYYDWRPIGYSLFLTIPALAGGNFEFLKIIVQLIIYSFIPVFIYLLFNLLFLNFLYGGVASLTGSLLYLIYPNFVVSSLQTVDTWLTTLILLIILFLFFKINLTGNYKYLIFLGLSISFLFLIRPAGAVSTGAFILLSYFLFVNIKKMRNWLFVPFLFLIITISLWGFRNYLIFNKWYPSFTNTGYNLWLGNNEHTYEFLESHLGDGTSIESDIIPYYESKWHNLSRFNELDKNSFLLNRAVSFIEKYPLIFFKNTVWKVVGYWLPIRVRDVPSQNSILKTIIVFIFSLPVIILSLISIVVFFFRKEIKTNRVKASIILFILLWMMPYLFFFTTARFREPTNFCLLYLSIDLIFSSNYKRLIF